jgi:hypothetical protein
MTEPHDDPRIHPGSPHRRIVGGIPTPDITLGKGFDGVSADVRAALAALFGGVPGVLVQRIDLVKRGRAETRLSVEIEGWSPSLHRLPVQYMRDVRTTGGEVEPGDAHEAFRDAAIEQLGRSHCGRHMGLMAPLPVEAESLTSGKPFRIEMRHMLVDASIPALMVAEEEDPVETLRRTVTTLHMQPESSEGGAYLANGVGLILECGLGRLVGADTTIDSRDHPASYDGLALHVHRLQIPETVLQEAPGRMLREIVSIHPSLDERIIKSAENDASRAGSLLITLEASLITFEQVPDAAARWAR